MTKTLDLSRSFAKFYENLQIPNKDKTTLQEARRDLRSHLRRHHEKIRFLTQGSYAYGTLIRPNHTPPQRMDLDDGAYFLNINIEKLEPKRLLSAVNSILDELARQKDWQLEDKSACCRLVIADDKHIDIPCYALRGEQPNERIDSTHSLRFASPYRDAGIPYFPIMPPGAVLLAHKEEGWIKSDPRLVIDGALECAQKHGRQFLRVCCYMKAWRDNQWKKPPMKSLLIMAMVEQAFMDERILQRKIGDDDAVFKTSGRMMDYLRGGCIKDPSDDSKCLDKNLTPEDKKAIVEKLQGLRRDMETALDDSSTDRQQASELMRRQFGKWFPQDSSLIIPLSVAAGINSQPATVRAVSPWAE